MGRKNPPQILNKDRLKTFSTKRLLRVLKSVRAYHSGIMHYAGPRCCEICREFLGDEKEWKTEVLDRAKPYENYMNEIKDILKTRAHVAQ